MEQIKTITLTGDENVTVENLPSWRYQELLNIERSFKSELEKKERAYQEKLKEIKPELTIKAEIYYDGNYKWNSYTFNREIICDLKDSKEFNKEKILNFIKSFRDYQVELKVENLNCYNIRKKWWYKLFYKNK